MNFQDVPGRVAQLMYVIDKCRDDGKDNGQVRKHKNSVEQLRIIYVIVQYQLETG
jgi:hypothetical protein